jgi:hypothetical protein
MDLISAFVLRARRVEAHSLIENEASCELLRKHANGQGMSIDIQWRQESPERTETFLVSEVPPEESLESLAARCRPFILQTEDVHHGRVLKAAGSQLHAANASLDVMTRYKELRVKWKATDPASAGLRAEYRLGDKDGPDITARATDVALALGWFYGDLVHADSERHAEAARFSIETRFRAAVGPIARIALVSMETAVQFITWRKAGLLTFDEAVMTADVSAAETHFRQPVEAYLGPVGDIPDSFTMPSGWQKFGDVFGSDPAES